MGQTLQGQSEEYLDYRQFNRKRAEFVLSNAISIGIAIYELASLQVCFDSNYDDDLFVNDDDEWRAGFTQNAFTIALVCGLVVEIVPLLSLSIIYGSLLDTKSAHKVPMEDTHCWGSFVARVFVPCGTSFIGIIMGLVAISYAFENQCDGNGGETSSILLAIAGYASMAFGGYTGVVFVVLSTCACCKVPGPEADSNCCQNICRGIRGCVHTVLKYVVVVDIAWQLLSVIISYRAGTFSVGIAWLVAFMTASAGWRATAASLYVIAWENNVAHIAI